MFKRILKVVGIVLLGFVLLIGGVVAFMAIRGDFKKQVINPTAISFSITKTELLFDANLIGQESLKNEQIFTFTILAEPLNVTETECILNVMSGSSLIQFKEWKNGKWVDYNSNKFYINKPIYFQLKDVTEENVDEYDDGVVTIKITDKSGMLRQTLDLEIDRNITSISFFDRGVGKENNNKIINGLFGYELENGYSNNPYQKLEAIEGEDYPLQVITAPLKADKPFNGEYPEGDSRNFAKIYEIYYIENNQPRRLTHYDEVVKFQRYNDEGQIVEETCEFLKYDTTNNVYVFNSTASGDYEFKLATYPNYKIQNEKEQLKLEGASFIEILNSNDMITKTAVITVNGSEAEKVEFEGDITSGISMQLLKDNKLVVNNNLMADAYNLGLTLTKTFSGTEITGRYNELQFLGDEHFTKNLKWIFKDENSLNDIQIEFYQDGFHNIKAKTSGLEEDYLDSSTEYDVKLIKESNYMLTLNHTETIDGTTTETIITFVLVADDITGNVLSLQKENGKVNIEVLYIQEVEGTYTPQMAQLSVTTKLESCFILDGIINEEEKSYSFKSLTPGIYISLLGKRKSDTLAKLINEDFIANIEYNNSDSIITIKPTSPTWTEENVEIKLYAVVVNSNGSWTYTAVPRGVSVREVSTSINVNNDGVLSLPIVIEEDKLLYGDGFDVEDLLELQNNGSYSEILMFAPKYTLLTLTDRPSASEWNSGLMLYVLENGEYKPVVSSEVEWAENTYYSKNNYQTIDMISFVDAGVEYFLLGYLENGEFVNKIVPTASNYKSKLYPVLIRSNYLQEHSRLQTAEEYINDILANKISQINASIKIDGVIGTNVTINCDLSLLKDRLITKSEYIVVDESYNSGKTYYILNTETGEYEVVQVPQSDIDMWNDATKVGYDKYLNYYQKIDYINAGKVLNSINTELTYYTLNIENGKTILNRTDTPTSVDDLISCYIVVNRYIIDTCEQDKNDINVNTYAVSGNIVLTDKYVTFILSSDEYETKINNDGQNIFGVGYSKIYTDKFITATSYYDFAHSAVSPIINFNGTYFDHEGAKIGDAYNIIAGHKEVDVNWEGVKDGELIKDKTTQVALYVNNLHNETILNNILSNLTIKALAYDDKGVCINDDGISEDNIKKSALSIGYITAPIEFNPQLPYYVEFDENKEAVITQEDIANWSTKYKEYYIKAILCDIEVSSQAVMDDGYYVRFVWEYTGTHTPYVIYSPKTYILSRNVTGFDIDLDVYRKLDETPANIVGCYIYEADDKQYVLINDDNKNDYLTDYDYYTKYDGEICYDVEVGYDLTNDKYTYKVYAVDNNANRLYYNDGTESRQIYSAPHVAFGLEQDQGWIKLLPIYAIKPTYEIVGNNNILFEYDNEQNQHTITFAQVTDTTVNNGFVDVVLQSNEATMTIKVKVTQDGKFTFNNQTTITDDNLATITESSKSYALSSIYKYNDTSIDKQAVITIKDDFIIVDGGVNVSSNYEIIANNYNGYTIAEKLDSENWMVELKYDDANKKWIISRNTFKNVTLNLEYTTLLGTVSQKFEFTSPYKDIHQSTTNKTNIIYSGTKFIIGTHEETDALWALGVTDGYIKIGYSLNGGDEFITSNGGVWTLESVPAVSELTNCEFTLYYCVSDGGNTYSEEIGKFVLTISPNMLITNNTSGIKQTLNDLDNNTYDLQDSDNVTIKKYAQDRTNNTIYDSESLEDVTSAVFKYEYRTYLDEACTQPYSANIVNIDGNGILTVNRISKLGTYYVKVLIINDDAILGDIVIGEIKFKIESKSQVVNNANPTSIVAKTSIEYTLAELQQAFEIERAGESNALTDIFWFDTTNQNIELVYNYGTYSLKQTFEYVEYNNDWQTNQTYYWLDNGVYVTADSKQEGVTYYILEKYLTYYEGETKIGTYKLIGTNYNMDNYSYDVFTNKFSTYIVDSDVNANNFVNSTYYVLRDGKYEVATEFKAIETYYQLQLLEATNYGNIKVLNTGVMHCIQNAYLFQNVSNINEILGVSIENTGKNVYRFTIGADSVTETHQTLGSLVELGLLYNDYGKDLTTNALYVDTIEYTVQLVFNNNNVISNEVYNINVEPYKIASTTNKALNDVAYTLHGDANAWFVTDGNISNISFEPSDDYDIKTVGNVKTIIFHAKGNSYVSKIPVTISYDDGRTYTYNVDIEVLNKTKVNIKYPFNITDTTKPFNATVSEFTTSVNNYDAIDLANWLNIDTSIVDWTSNSYITYDIALKGDIINLETDELLNIRRYSTATRSELNVDNSTIDSVSQTIGKVELVAVSSTYAGNVQNVVDNIALNGNTIAISQSLNYTGYVLFKVYAGDTGAYGYYALRIVDDNQFENVIEYGVSRNTRVVSPVITNGSAFKIIDVVDNKFVEGLTNTNGASIADVANIGYDLIDDTNYSNVYIFMVDSYYGSSLTNSDVEFNVGGITTTIDNGQLISNEQILPNSNEIQTIIVAVVVQSGTSLVHVCNYKLILQVDMKVTPSADINDTNMDTNYHAYSTKPISFDYEPGANNEINLSNYFDVTSYDGGDVYSLNNVSIDYVAGKYSSDYLAISGNNINYVEDTNGDGTNDITQTIATLNANNTLTLSKAVSESMFFYLSLEYSNGFTISLRIELKAYNFNSTSQFIVGEYNLGEFNNKLDLTQIFVTYNGEYNVKCEQNVLLNGDLTTSSNGTNLSLAQQNSDYNDRITITLKDVYPNISKTVIVTIKSNINATYTKGQYQATNRVELDKIDYSSSTELERVGSKLNVSIVDNTIKVQSGNGSVDYLTINVGSFTSAYFTLTQDDGTALLQDDANSTPYEYFVNGTSTSKDIVLNGTGGALKFVHSAQARNLRLNVTICNYSDTYYKAVKETDASYTANTYFNLEGKLIASETYKGDYYNMVEVTDTSVDVFKPNYYYSKVNDNEYNLIKGAEAGYVTEYPLFITMPKTYELSTTYRVNGATYETVVNNKELTLKADADTSISNHFFGTETDVVTGVNPSRIQIDVAGIKYYGYDNIEGLGLLDDNNPNKLMFTLNAVGTNVSTIDNGKLVFRSDDNAPTNTLTMANTTTSIEYKFKVLTESADYSKVTYNKELLQIDTGTDQIVDYVSVPYSQLDSAGDMIEWAYLQYLPTDEIEGQVGWVHIEKTSGGTGNLNYNFVREIGSADYASKVMLSGNNLQENTTYTFEISIITLNGKLPSVKLVVSDYDVTYSYGESGQGAYESAFAGTQLGKLTDNAPNGNVRVQATVNGNNIFEENDYTLTYIGAVNGNVSHWYLGDELDYSSTDESMVKYNADKGVIELRSVKDNTYITMIFEVKDSSNQVLGRIYYNLLLQNNIVIELNEALESQNTIDLYLGSTDYTSSSNNTTINLLNGDNDDDGVDYNNLFVTYALKTYDKNGAVQKVPVTLDGDNVANYLSFSLTAENSNTSDQSIKMDKQTVSVSADGKLNISGNPTGTFKLNVYSTNGTGYGESFTIRINPYDHTTAQYSDQINQKSGTGWISEEKIPLFKDKASSVGDYALATYREGYDKDAKQVNTIFGDGVTVSYQMLTFPYNTSISDIKASTLWNSEDAVSKTINPGKEPTPVAENTVYLDNSGILSVALPQVKYSSDGSRLYEIVSFRFTITYNGDPSYYYAHYLVYNKAQAILNKTYQDNDKVITYAEKDNLGNLIGAWQSGNTITIMDLDNTGMYAMVETVMFDNAPDDWDSEDDSKNYKIYYQQDVYKKGDIVNGVTLTDDSPLIGTFTGKYIHVEAVEGKAPTYVKGKYYQLHTIATTEINSKYEAWIQVDGEDAKPITNLTYADGKITGKLPGEAGSPLFKNSALVKFTLKAVDGGAILVEENWTLKANNTIEPVGKPQPLRNLFLQSEIENQDYYYINVIGLISESYNEAQDFANNFTTTTSKYVKNATGVKVSESIGGETVYYTYKVKTITSGDCSYDLWYVTYQGNGGTSVFTIEASYYILVGNGKSNLISFNLNGGDYYINLTIDDSNIDSNKDGVIDFTTENTASIDLDNFINVWKWDGDFVKVEGATKEVIESSDIIDVSGTTITLKDIDKITQNPSVSVVIKAGDTGDTQRAIELYFNIVINAKTLVDGYMSYNQAVSEAMADDGELKAEDVNNNLVLKKELLSLVKYNGREIATDSVTLSYYNISVSQQNDHYVITYVFNNNVSTYTRTFRMALS